MPTVVIYPRTGRSPFQLYLIALIVISGMSLTVGASSNTITDAMGHPYTNLWGGTLALGGAVTLLGIYWPREPITGMLIERTGLVGLGGGSLIWSILVVWRVHLNAAYLSASLTFGLFLACVAQWRWINKSVNQVIKAIHDK